MSWIDVVCFSVCAVCTTAISIAFMITSRPRR
jgi:hypothetical protein